jgi:hypothetical protein
MDTKEEALFQHSTANTRIENESNALLEHVKAQVTAQVKERQEWLAREKGSVQVPEHGFVCKS